MSGEIVLPEQAGGAVAPVRVEALVEIVDAFEKFKSMVLRDGDFWLDRKENKKRVRKSGWLKFALACNISLEKIGERAEMLQLPGLKEPVLTFHFDYRAVAPSGRYAEASGSASLNEREKSDKIVHDTRSLAQTRAMNRAISNLVGGGEISAEELTAEQEEPVKEAPAAPPPKKGPQFRMGRVTPSVVAYNLRAVGFGEDDLLVTEEGGDVVIEPVRDLTEDELAKIDGALGPMGGAYQEVGYRGQWRIPRRA